MSKKELQSNIMPDFIEYLGTPQSIISIFIGATSCLLVNKVKLYKKFISETINLDQPKNVEEAKIDIIYTPVNFSAIPENEFKEYISIFWSTLIRNISPEYLKLFNKNIIDLKFRKKFQLIKTTVPAYYKAYNNEIVFRSKNIAEDIYHELLHLTTRYVDKYDNVFIGFSQLNDEDTIGEGINEGYTELLTKRYFPKTTRCYPYQYVVASNIENLIGKDKMIELYFNCNLKGLITELSKYLDVSEVFELINGLDVYTKNMNSSSKRYFDFSFDYIYRSQEILLKAHMEKYKQNNPNININDLKSKIEEVKDGLRYQISSGNEFFMFDVEEDSETIMGKYLNIYAR